MPDSGYNPYDHNPYIPERVAIVEWIAQDKHSTLVYWTDRNGRLLGLPGQRVNFPMFALGDERLYL